jgi:hypothetical protein
MTDGGGANRVRGAIHVLWRKYTGERILPVTSKAMAEHVSEELFTLIHNPSKSGGFPYDHIVNEYVRQCDAGGLAFKSVKQILNHLTLFSDREHVETLNQVNERSILDFLGGLSVSESSKNRYLSSIAGLMRYALTKGYVTTLPSFDNLRYRSFPSRKQRVRDRVTADISHVRGSFSSESLQSLLSRGEDSTLEFKQTLEVDSHTGLPHKGVLTAALKTIAAFLNEDGGTLLIGVSDNGQIRGLSRDFQLCHKKDEDGFEQKLRDLLQQRFRPVPLGSVSVSFYKEPEGTVCRIDIDPFADVVLLDGKEVYARDGNTTRKLENANLVQWMKRKFRGR